MGSLGIFSPLLVAWFLLQGACWAGPINSLQFNRFKESEPFSCNAGLYPQDIQTKQAIYVRVFMDSDTESPPGIWGVTIAIGIVVLICLLFIVFVLARRKRQRLRKVTFDEERGFGQHPEAQPVLLRPPRSYNGTSTWQSSLAHPEKLADSRNFSKTVPPPLLTVSPPEEIYHRPRRVPVPLPSPWLIGLPPSPGLPTSASRQSQRPPSHASSSLLGSQCDVDPSPSSQAQSSSLSKSSTKDDSSVLEVPLSAGGLERMIIQMEIELGKDTV